VSNLIDKRLLKSLYQIQGAKLPLCLSWNQDTYVVANLPQSLHLPTPPKPFPQPSQKILGQRTEMTLDRRLANITDP